MEAVEQQVARHAGPLPQAGILQRLPVPAFAVVPLQQRPERTGGQADDAGQQQPWRRTQPQHRHVRLSSPSTSRNSARRQVCTLADHHPCRCVASTKPSPASVTKVAEALPSSRWKKPANPPLPSAGTAIARRKLTSTMPASAR
ncbi:hypothetical protein G6F65_019444 [Rhizopus arrhizus]|nr:hypothetical protein G6F65_019444 [Rhizopus arrhizus]